MVLLLFFNIAYSDQWITMQVWSYSKEAYTCAVTSVDCDVFVFVGLQEENCGGSP